MNGTPNDTRAHATQRGYAVTTRRGPAVIVSPQDCEVFTLSLPPVPESEYANIVRLQLRAQYPGNGATVVDWKPSGGRDRRSVVAYAIQEDRLGDYRDQAGGRGRLLTGVELAVGLRSLGRDRVVALVLGSRAQIVTVRDDAITDIRKTTRTRLVRELESIVAADGAPDADTEPHDVPCRDLAVVITGDIGDTADLPEAIGDHRVTFVELDQAIRAAFGARRTPFAARSHLGATIALVVVLAALVAGVGSSLVGLGRWRDEMIRAQSEIDQQLVLARARYSEGTALEDELLAFTPEEPRSAPVVHPYIVVSLIAEMLDGAATIDRVTVIEGRFEVGATGREAWPAFERMRAQPLFVGVELKQSIFDPENGTERFVISGVYSE
jgi:hypothetical protein